MVVFIFLLQNILLMANRVLLKFALNTILCIVLSSGTTAQQVSFELEVGESFNSIPSALTFGRQDFDFGSYRLSLGFRGGYVQKLGKQVLIEAELTYKERRPIETLLLYGIQPVNGQQFSSFSTIPTHAKYEGYRPGLHNQISNFKYAQLSFLLGYEFRTAPAILISVAGGPVGSYLLNRNDLKLSSSDFGPQIFELYIGDVYSSLEADLPRVTFSSFDFGILGKLKLTYYFSKRIAVNISGRFEKSFIRLQELENFPRSDGGKWNNYGSCVGLAWTLRD